MLVLQSLANININILLLYSFGFISICVLQMKVCYIVRSPNTRCHPNVLLLEESEVQKRFVLIASFSIIVLK